LYFSYNDKSISKRIRPKTAYQGSGSKKRPFTGMLDYCTSTYHLDLAKAKQTYSNVNTSMYQYGNIPIFNFERP
jgi:hypothetical protein